MANVTQQPTPGVYIDEINAFPNSVVEVPTGVPAFVGYTEFARLGSQNVAGTPVRIQSLSEYHQIFGAGPGTLYSQTISTDGDVSFQSEGPNYYMYNALRLFFNNGGGACWIMSVGGYANQTPSSADFSQPVWDALARETEPSIYVVPDAVALDFNSYVNITQTMMSQCQKLRNRIALLDLYDGAGPDIQTAIDNFRKIRLGDDRSYGVIYGPWVNTTLFTAADATFYKLNQNSRAQLVNTIKSELTGNDAPLTDAIQTVLNNAMVPTLTPAQVKTTHETLDMLSSVYRTSMENLQEYMNIMPPSGAIAGVYARMDREMGVYKAPANVGMTSVLSPTYAVSDSAQEDWNVPLDGKAINAIREFPGRGTLIWGARTLDGNSQDYRYVSVRRTLIMLEQSIFNATQAYVFSPNDAGTWAAVKSMLENFLNNQWKAGVLAGSSPTEAYEVSVGLGSTMTGNDILNAYMNVTVHVAVARPAEFIVITFQQKMQS